MKKTFVVYLPIESVFCFSPSRREKYSLPSPTARDWDGIAALRGSVSMPFIADDVKAVQRPTYAEEMAIGVKDLIVERSKCLKMAHEFSFYQPLYERILNEMKGLASKGADRFLISTECSANLPVCHSEPAVYWIARAMLGDIGKEDGISLGLQIKNKDGWAMDIACRCGLDFVMVDDDVAWHSLRRSQMTDGRSKMNPPMIYYRVPQGIRIGDAPSELADSLVVLQNEVSVPVLLSNAFLTVEYEGNNWSGSHKELLAGRAVRTYGMPECGFDDDEIDKVLAL